MWDGVSAYCWLDRERQSHARPTPVPDASPTPVPARFPCGGAAEQGRGAAAVQTQLKSVLDSALADARRSVLPGQMEARSGRFSVSPRYGREGRIAAWTGTAELILDGRDFFLISQTAGRITGMTVSGMAFSLSREQLQRAEALAQQQAVERFRGRATELARGFGFSSYTLREVSVQSGEQAPPPRPRMLALEARSAASDAPVPVEAGRSTVMVTISGSVQLQ